MKPSERAVRSTPVPLLSIALRAARTRSTESEYSNKGSAGLPVESSIDSPATPVATAAPTLAATASGSTAKPPSKSPFTGISTLELIPLKCASASSLLTPLSGRH